MKVPSDIAADHPQRQFKRWWLVVLAAIVIILIASLRSLAGLWTDQLWFSSEGISSVFTTLLGVKLALFGVFGLIFALGIMVNLVLVSRTARSLSVHDVEDEMVIRYQQAARPYLKWIYIAIAVIFGIGAGFSAMSQWQNYLLFTHAQSFDAKDPQFGLNVGFYVFRLPFIQFLIGWVIFALVAMTIISAIFHYLNGGIRGSGRVPRLRPAVKVHLSILLALIAATKAVGYWFARYSLVVNGHGYVSGAGYTDIHARMPAINLLFWVAIATAVILVVNIWRPGFALPGIALGVWAIVAIVVSVLYPSLLQTFKVTPAQSSLEHPYIQRNITATRAAYGLTDVAQQPFAGSQTISAAQIKANAQTLANIRLWDPDPQISLQTFAKLQGLRSYYNFNSVAMDRYTINGSVTPVLEGVRQLNAADLPSSSWVNTHLEYTHGNGIVIAPANQVQANGNPVFAVGNVPSVSATNYPTASQAGIYFGLNDPGYVVANSRQPELDYQTVTGANVMTNYHGSGGVKVNGILRRAAFALRLGDFNLLVSNLVTNQSRIMFVRDIQTMAQKAAPFLSFDSQPYAVLVNGHIDWVLNGYTTSSQYPYSQNASSVTVPQGSGLPSNYNYVRNSVAVVIDAYSGSMNFYNINQRDPILKAYEAAFPGMFKPISEMSSALRAHLRYPQGVFAVQAAMYGRYHITNVSNFYNAGDAWTLSQTVGAGSPSQTVAVSQQTLANGLVVSGGTVAMSPLYQVESLPGSSTQTFTISDAFVPSSTNGTSQNLTAFMMATSDPTDYGHLTAYATPSGQNVLGPIQADAEIEQSTKVSSIITPLDQHGSSVLLGNVLMIPIDQSMLYVRPLYVTSSTNPLPQLKYVIAVFNSHVDIESSLSLALSNVFSVSVPSNGSGGSGNVTVTPAIAAQARALLAQANADYQAAQAALSSGDLAAYQTNIQAMYSALLSAQALLGSSSTKSTTTSGSSSATSSVASHATTTTTVKKTSVTSKKTVKSAATRQRA